MDGFVFPVIQAGAMARLELGRPDEGNALTRGMMVTLAETIRAAAARPEVSLVVIEARGAQFCRGRDGRGESSAGLNPWQQRVEMMGPVLGVYDAIAAAPVPVVALVQGAAIGFGAALAGACDMTIASSAARFSFPEIRHNIAPTLAMAATHRTLPAKVLAWLIYSAEELDADAAAAVGLVSKVLPAEGFGAAAEVYLADIASRPRLILQTIKHFQQRAAAAPGMASDYAGALMALVRNAGLRRCFFGFLRGCPCTIARGELGERWCCCIPSGCAGRSGIRWWRRCRIGCG